MFRRSILFRVGYETKFAKACHSHPIEKNPPVQVFAMKHFAANRHN